MVRIICIFQSKQKQKNTLLLINIRIKKRYPDRERERLDNEMSEDQISSPVIEGSEDISDLSNEWVDEMAEIRKLECGIPIFSFQEAIKHRKQDMEFRVRVKMNENS